MTILYLDIELRMITITNANSIKQQNSQHQELSGNPKSALGGGRGESNNRKDPESRARTSEESAWVSFPKATYPHDPGTPPHVETSRRKRVNPNFKGALVFKPTR